MRLLSYATDCEPCNIIAKLLQRYRNISYIHVYQQRQWPTVVKFKCTFLSQTSVLVSQKQSWAAQHQLAIAMDLGFARNWFWTYRICSKLQKKSDGNGQILSPDRQNSTSHENLWSIARTALVLHGTTTSAILLQLLLLLRQTGGRQEILQHPILASAALNSILCPAKKNWYTKSISITLSVIKWFS